MKKFLVQVSIILIALSMSFGALAESPSEAHSKYKTGSAALTHTYTAAAKCYLKSIGVHFSATATQDTFTATIDSYSGSTYDVVLVSQAMNGYSDLVYMPDGDLLLEKGDKVVLAFANNDAVTWGTEIVCQN